MPNLHLAFVFWQPFLGYALFCVVRLKKVNFILKKKKLTSLMLVSPGFCITDAVTDLH
jgi:hypothetical protein